MAAIVAFTLSLVVTFRSNSLICTVEPMGTCSLRYCIRLAMVSLAEKWNSWMPVSLAMCAMLVSFTPQPASRVMRPAACCWSSFSKGMPSSAVGCCPEVRIRSHPRLMISSSAFGDCSRHRKPGGKLPTCPELLP